MARPPTREHDSLAATMASRGGRLPGDSMDGVTLAPADTEPVDPLEKQLTRRALFPGRVHPIQIGRFTVLSLLGRGGMGVVYACYDDLLDRKVAVKVLHGEVTREHASARLLREAQALARLSHPNVVAVHDVGVVGERVYVAMEFVEGQTFGAWVEATRPGWREVLRVICAAGEGLAAAHAKGLIHRDIKPDNIMVGADGRVRVMDFGLAHGDGEATGARPALSEGVRHGHDAVSAELTRTGAVMGTPAYMASEQFLGAPTDARSDQFSLCATAWEALYGQAPFAGETLVTLAANVTSGTLTPPPAGSKVPAWLRRVLERGLRPRAEDRHADTRALLQALRADPTRRRWIAGITAGGVLVVLAGVGAGAAVEQRAVAACIAEGAAIDEDWNDETRAALERSFLATGKPHAAGTLAHTLPWFERWATAWREAAVAGCRAHDIEATWDDDLRLRALDCLAEARGNFTALVQELADTDADGLMRATSAAAGLPSVDACTRPEALRERAMLRPELHDAVVAVRAQLARAASLEAAGRYAEGLAVAAAAREAARATAWAPVLAQAELRLSTLAERKGDYAAAERGLLRALAAAREASSPVLALTGAVDLVYVVGYRASRPAEGKVWAESAQLQLALLPGEHPLAEGDLRNNLGGVLYVTGDYAGAAYMYMEALALREGALGQGHPRVSESLNNLAGARYALGEYDESARLYDRALVLQDQAFGPEHPQVATTLSNLAMVHESTGAYTEAIRLLTRAISIKESALGVDHPQLANGLSNLGLVHQATGNFAEAARLYVRALALQERALGPDHPQVADSLANLGTVRFATGDHEEAIRLFNRSLEIYEKIDKQHPMVANALGNLAQVHYARAQYADAQRLYTRALAIFEGSVGPEHPSTAYVLHGLGATHTALGDTTTAVPILERALAIREANGVQPQEIAEARFSLARALESAQHERARALAEQALRVLATATGSAREHAEIAAWLAAHP